MALQTKHNLDDGRKHEKLWSSIKNKSCMQINNSFPQNDFHCTRQQSKLHQRVIHNDERFQNNKYFDKIFGTRSKNFNANYCLTMYED
jgi:hypothetical protein